MKLRQYLQNNLAELKLPKHMDKRLPKRLMHVETTFENKHHQEKNKGLQPIQLPTKIQLGYKF